MQNLPDPSFPSIRSTPGAPRDAGWMDTYSAARDDQIRRLTEVLQGGGGLGNLNLDIVTFEARDEVAVNVRSTKIRGPVTGAILLSTNLNDHVRLKFSPSSTLGLCSLELIADIPTPAPFTATALLLGS